MVVNLLLNRSQCVIARLQIDARHVLTLVIRDRLRHLLSRVHRRIVRDSVRTRVEHRERRLALVHRDLTVINRRGLHALNIHLHRRQGIAIDSPLVEKAPVRTRVMQMEIRVLRLPVQSVGRAHRRLPAVLARLNNLVIHPRHRGDRTLQRLAVQQCRIPGRNLGVQQATRMRTVPHAQGMEILPHLAGRAVHQLIRHNQCRRRNRGRHHNTDHPQGQDPFHRRKITHRTRVTQVVRLGFTTTTH